MHIKFHHATPKAVEINDNTTKGKENKTSTEAAITFTDTVYTDTTTEEAQLDAVETTTANLVTENPTSTTKETP